MTFGITPTYPATSYGYIRPGAKLNGGAALAIDAFVEKPNAEKAGAYIAEHFLWNSGNFLFRADVMLDEIARFEPEIAAAAKSAVAGITNDLDFLRLPAEPFARAPKKSIDYAVMERTARAAVVPRRSRLVRRRQLELGLGRAATRPRRQRRRRPGGVPQQPQQPRAFGGQHRHRRGRPRQHCRGGDVRRRTGGFARQSGRGQGGGRTTQSAEPAAGRSAFAGLSAVGLLPGRRYRRALSGQTHRGEAERHAFAAKAFPSRRALGRGARRRRKSPSGRKSAPFTRTNRSTFRSAASIALPIPARFRSN